MIPTYAWNQAPLGLATVRQLRARGLRPNGQDIAARLIWRHGRNATRHAWLYRVDLAAPKRTATPAQLVAIAKALRARRTCPTCRREQGYYIPTRWGECLTCHARTEAADHRTAA